MSMARTRVAAIWTISAWPALNFVMLNLEVISAQGVRSCLGVVVLTLAFGAVGQALHWFASRRSRGDARAGEKSGGVVVVAWLALVVLLFGYSLLGDGLAALRAHLGWRLPQMAVWLVLAAVTAALVYVSRGKEKLHVAAITFCLVAGAATTFMCVQRLLSFEGLDYDAGTDLAVVADKPARLPGLNVYYVILDSYAGRSTLAKETGFDNGEFMARMAQRGFVSASTDRSNYLQTALTLGGIFALNYPFTDDPRSRSNEGAGYPDVFARTTPPALIRRISAAGYVGWYSPSFWTGCVQRHLKCIVQPGVFEPDNLTRSFLEPTPFGRPLIQIAAHYYDGLGTLRSRLPLVLATEKPAFVFVHNMAPHPPFLLDSKCRPRTGSFETRSAWKDAERGYYADAVKCVNLDVERLLDVILRLNPEALIVLQGDHGSAFNTRWDAPMASWSSDEIAERSSYLNLIRAPADCRRWLDRPLGQINTARFVLGCLEGKAPVYVSERTYLSTYSMREERGVLRLAPN